MGESLDNRINNLRKIAMKYTNSDQQYIADKLSDLINKNFRNVDFDLTYRDLFTNTELKKYLIDVVYAGILKIISDLKEYRAIEKTLYQDRNNEVIKRAPSGPTFTNDQDNQNFNAKFNSAFSEQLAKNRLDRMIEEEKKLAYLMDNSKEELEEKKITLFHNLTIKEITDNLANSIVLMFKQVYNLDINGLMNSQENYIYYGIICIFIYLVLKITVKELSE